MKRLTTIAVRPTLARSQKGLSLVELMVALTIGLLILVGVAQVFVTSRATYTMEEGLARTQESGRFAMEFLTRDIRVAGYMGCNSTLNEGEYNATKSACYSKNGGGSKTICSMVKNPNELSSFTPEGIRGYYYIGSGGTSASDWSPALPVTYALAGQAKAYTDIIVLQHASSFNAQLTGNTEPSNANIQILPSSPLDGVVEAGSILMVADCKGGDIFKATAVSNGSKITIAHANNFNIDSKLSHKYKDGADISMLSTQIYYVGTGTDGEPALMMKQTEKNGVLSAQQEVVPGIEQMRILYGDDTEYDPANPAAADGVANIYRSAADIQSMNRWGGVVSVRIGLLIRTPTKVESVSDTQTYEIVDGITVDPPDDKRRRQVYRSTIQLRN